MRHPPGPCTADLTTHHWRSRLCLDLGLTDVDGFTEVFLVWVCTRCDRHVWADGVVHQTTPPMTPPEWEAHIATLQTVWQDRARALRQAGRQQARMRLRLLQGR